MIHVRCPHCHKALKAPEKCAGSSARCPGCGGKVAIPALKTAEDIALMARTVAPKKLGVKASGGVRTYADAMKMIRAGATRVGSSNSVKMMDEAAAAQ